LTLEIRVLTPFFRDPILFFVSLLAQLILIGMESVLRGFLICEISPAFFLSVDFFVPLFSFSFPLTSREMTPFEPCDFSDPAFISSPSKHELIC